MVGKKVIVAAVLLTPLAIAGFLYPIAQTHVVADEPNSFSEVGEFEAKAIIVKAAEGSYLGSRFDTIEVSLSGTVLRVYTHDADACSDSVSVQTIEHVVDLSIYTERTANTKTVDYHSEPLTFVRFAEWSDRNRELSEKMEAFLSQARAEVGGGQKASLLASEWFLQEYPLDTLPSYFIRSYCPSGSSISFARDFMTFQITDPQKLLDAFSVISGR